MTGLRLCFLGTGAAGGTPGQGRSRRRESSVLLDADTAMLIDVSRDFSAQAVELNRLDAVLLTHAHRDAAGGLPQLESWLADRGVGALPVYAHPGAVKRLERDHPGLEHCQLHPVEPGRRVRIRRWSATALEVPHTPGDFPTVAWRVSGHGRRLVYASDIAALTPELARLARGVDHLILDGATWQRRIFTHLRIDEDLPLACGWTVGRIWLTQIGRSAPPHARLAREVERLCARARPAYDGLVVPL